MKIGILVCLLPLAGCMQTGATQIAGGQPTIQDALAAWKGKKSDDLIVAWGPPQNQVPLPHGGSLMTYIASKTIEGRDMSGLGQAFGMGSASVLLDASGTENTYDCTVNVKVSPRNTIDQAVLVHMNNPILQNLCEFVKPPSA